MNQPILDTLVILGFTLITTMILLRINDPDHDHRLDEDL